MARYLEWVRNNSFYYFNNNLSFMATTFLDVYQVIKTFVSADMVKSKIKVYQDYIWNLESLATVNFQMFDAGLIESLSDYHPLILEEALHEVVDASRDNSEGTINLIQQTEPQEVEFAVWCFIIPIFGIAAVYKWYAVWWIHSKIIDDIVLFIYSSLKFMFSIKGFLILNADFNIRAGRKKKTYRLWSESKLMTKQWLECENMAIYILLVSLYSICQQYYPIWAYYLFLSDFYICIFSFFFSSMLLVLIFYLLCLFEWKRTVK